MSYKEPVNQSCTEIEIKKSRFISYSQKVQSRKEAVEFIDKLREEYPDARHICWGYLIGDPKNSTNSGCNDDGEPSGTAGKPILAQINYSNIGNVVVAVVRYFGGIRLGAGGLVRAYRESAQSALLALETEEFIPQEEVIIELPFNEEGDIRRLISNLDGVLITSKYDSMVKINALLPSSKVTELEVSLGNMTAKIKQH
ncbi:YigZ family protein [Thiomicrorhabdus lithotrophica]|uniref:YigZ family protein n=1 Tax=Thiomicrorhabdus lithotrophica TaxID=2949997 RepID=A0ABY8CBR2_9GAMM|nr:YigZ family protein [Thiomicrorhabdus lithotrophica]WEJ62642.1 YigZ family protein [Thiomicrorhabdus lithotrophica]